MTVESTEIIQHHRRKKWYPLILVHSRDEDFASSLKVVITHENKLSLEALQEIQLTAMPFLYDEFCPEFIPHIFSVNLILTGRLFQNCLIPGFRYMGLCQYVRRVSFSLSKSSLCWKVCWYPMVHPEGEEICSHYRSFMKTICVEPRICFFSWGWG